MKHYLISLFLLDYLLQAVTQCTNPTSEFHLEGDFLIGGLFDIHDVRDPVLFSLTNYRRFQVMRFSVEEINNSTSLLPNISLGYEVFDHCSETHSFPDIFNLISVNGLIRPWGDPQKQEQHKPKVPKVISVVGPRTSNQALTVAPLIMMDLIPMVNYGSSTSAFSENLMYPSFLRTVHSNKHMIEVVVLILLHFNWRWVSFLNSDNNYGNDGRDLFIKRIKDTEICLAYTKELSQNTNYSQVLTQIDEQSIYVIIVFAPERYAELLIESAIELNVTKKVWIAVEAWSLNKKLPKEKGIQNIGTVLGISEPMVMIPGFDEFVYSFKEQSYCENEDQRFCNQICNCSDLSAREIIDADPSYSFPVYSAIYAIAHALHNTLQCGSGECQRNVTVEKILLALEKMLSNFSCVCNCLAQAPTSLCSKECPVGHAKHQDGIHKCCFNCEICPNGTYINMDPENCVECNSETEWSGEGSTSCNLRLVEYVPFTSGGAIINLIATGAFVGFTAAVSALFAINYNTPVVRSAGGPMCFLILACLCLCSVSVFFYFGKPSASFCIMRYLLFFLFYTLCLACFAVRSFQIVCIFKIAAKYPALQSWWMKYHGQWLFIPVVFVTQAFLLTVEYLHAPPKPFNETTWAYNKIILSCDMNLSGSSVSLLLIVSLCFFCFIFSYMGKDLPKNYNEAKAITFCLVLLILTWIISATANILYHGRHLQSLNAMAILSSLYSFLLWYFLPKCYIIIFQPSKNTQQHFQGLIQSYTKTISQ
uniref:Taste receptor type 1 member 1-like n=1 Tax=Sphaeramia orbicularis TaxID=375764 RepID=A0A672YN52_9TELE